MPEFLKVPGFVVYREFQVSHPFTGCPDLTREVLCEVEWEDAAMWATFIEGAYHTDSSVYYEPGTIEI